MLALTLYMMIGLGVPADIAVALPWAAVVHGADPTTQLGWMVSEHSIESPRYSGRCSDKGACGRAHQFTGEWPERFGYTDDQRDETWPNLAMGARLIVYSMGRHAKKCADREHHWIAHLKASNKWRDHPKVARRVKKARRYQQRARFVLLLFWWL